MSTRAFWGRCRTDEVRPAPRVRVSGLTIPCGSFAATRRFYQDLLGLVVSGSGRTHCALDAGGLSLLLVDASKVSGFSRGAGQGVFLELAVGDLAGTRAALGAAGARLGPVRADGSVTVQDPEGNLLSLVAASRRP